MAEITYKQDIGLKTNDLYNARDYFKNNAYKNLPGWQVGNKSQPDRLKNTVEEKMLIHPFHGRIDKDGDAIYLILPKIEEANTNIKIKNPLYEEQQDPKIKFSIPPEINAITELKLPNSTTGLYVPRFIAKAFFELNSYYRDGLLTGKLEKNGVYSPLAPIKAIVNHEIEYKKYFNSIINSFEQYIEINKLYKTIESIKEYIEQLIIYIMQQETPVVTLSRYILSKHADPFISGLSLSITTDDHNNDLNKFKSYIDNNNFNFFLESCTRFGFMVNANAPWELYFHFASQPAKEYLNRYGFTDEEDLYRRLYRKAFYSDITFLKNYILKFYNQYAKNSKKDIFCNGLTKCGDPIIKKIYRSPISFEELNLSIDEKKWLEYYFTIRLKEENIERPEKIKQSILREASFQNTESALKHINNYILANKETIDLRKIQNY